MPRTRAVFDAKTKQEIIVPFTPEEEAEQDAMEAADFARKKPILLEKEMWARIFEATGTTDKYNALLALGAGQAVAKVTQIRTAAESMRSGEIPDDYRDDRHWPARGAP